MAASKLDHAEKLPEALVPVSEIVRQANGPFRSSSAADVNLIVTMPLFQLRITMTPDPSISDYGHFGGNLVPVNFRVNQDAINIHCTHDRRVMINSLPPATFVPKILEPVPSFVNGQVASQHGKFSQMLDINQGVLAAAERFFPTAL